VNKKLTKQSSPVSEIARLHAEICKSAEDALAKAIRIGELLTEEKEHAGHGNWLVWLADNVPFTSRTATNYMRVFAAKSETVSDFGQLTDIYKTLTEPKQAAKPTMPVSTGLSALAASFVAGSGSTQRTATEDEPGSESEHIKTAAEEMTEPPFSTAPNSTSPATSAETSSLSATSSSPGGSSSVSDATTKKLMAAQELKIWMPMMQSVNAANECHNWPMFFECLARAKTIAEKRSGKV
jgi:hypothetical protein